ncbi:MAG: T9SS type A sorting domain-containing protein [Ignavibacteriaceae bacterium]|nr:T9SS type A sorting domain-containing protein [Ignavibacteriaceae bacterium]
MKRFFLFLLLLLLARGSTYAQADTIIIEIGGVIVKQCPVSEIDWITFAYPPVVIKDEGLAKTIPTQFAISQNYPNPFNPTTKLQFQIPTAGKVKLNIYDINGRLVKEVFSGEKEAGLHTLDWNAKDLNGRQVASGIYFYSVQFNNTLLTKKMIYLK